MKIHFSNLRFRPPFYKIFRIYDPVYRFGLEGRWYGLNHTKFISVRYYIVYAHQSQKSDKVTEFFEQFDSWGNRESWRDWFAFPFTKNPETNPIFEPYFQ